MEPTQGPYTARLIDKSQLTIVSEPTGHLLAEVYPYHPNAEANAALLAASWEMKEALEALLNAESTSSWSSDIEKGRAALAKATQIT